jgi:beta-N-acetylhexosaminidase
MTDDSSMQALPGSRAEVAARAIAAGVDAVLYCNAPLTDKAKVAEAAGQMTDAAQARAERAIAARITPETVDIEELKAKHNALLNRA